jgi:hypothetical protein
MITAFFAGLGAWGWILAALILLGIEIVAPGFLFLWLGIGALIVGLIGLLEIVGAGWSSVYAQFVAFAVFSLVAALVGRRLYDPRRTPSEEPTLNDRYAQLIGSKVTLSQAIENGTGRAVIGDTTWQVSGPDMPSGGKVVVTGAENGRLLVEPIPV